MKHVVGEDGRGKKYLLTGKQKAAVRHEARSISTARSFRNPETDPLYDEIEADLFVEMAKAVNLGHKTDTPWEPFWHTLKARPRQHVEGDTYDLFPISEWHTREMRKATGMARASFAGKHYDEDEMLARAKTIFLAGGDHRRIEAWQKAHTVQLALFAEVTPRGDPDPVERHEVLADPSAVDPADVADPHQLSLLDHLREKADLTDRQRLISQMLAEESPTPTKAELARRFGKSETTITRDFARIRSELTIVIGPPKT